MRVEVELILVANRLLKAPPSAFIRSQRVPAGFDVADRYIEDAVEPGDLVITADIPLAAGVVARGALALNPRDANSAHNYGWLTCQQKRYAEAIGLSKIAVI
jgi:uncharacterized protein YaiI (UPF0178 family)